jgi:hypothetical protein
MRTILIVLGVVGVTCVASLLVGWLFAGDDDYEAFDYDAYERARMDLLMKKPPRHVGRRTEARDTHAR